MGNKSLESEIESKIYDKSGWVTECLSSGPHNTL